MKYIKHKNIKRVVELDEDNILVRMASVYSGEDVPFNSIRASHYELDVNDSGSKLDFFTFREEELYKETTKEVFENFFAFVQAKIVCVREIDIENPPKI